MKFAVLFEDNDEFAHKRQEFMADHLQFLRDNADRIESAGPLRNARSGEAAGGIWIVEADDVGAVEALVETDPFWPTGLRRSVRVLEWKQVFADGKTLI